MKNQKCNVCELEHDIGTPHPERIHPGKRTQRVTLAVVVYRDGLVRAVPAFAFPHKALESMSADDFVPGAGRPVGRAIVYADIPLDEVPTIEGAVER